MLSCRDNGDTAGVWPRRWLRAGIVPALPGSCQPFPGTFSIPRAGAAWILRILRILRIPGFRDSQIPYFAPKGPALGESQQNSEQEFSPWTQSALPNSLRDCDRIYNVYD